MRHTLLFIIINMNKYAFLFLIFIFSYYSCSSADENELDTPEINNNDTPVAVPPVTELKAQITQNPNELYLTWRNPKTWEGGQIIGVEIYYRPIGTTDEKK